ncbi:AI-2E family transporter [Thiohalobacter thiocyanaticus]|uniref:AI-2E family transporter n=1 Tax=Thiohalobacter thiocyanaticus TaxID=585455 RepID=A0A426QH36_9GAMM|nr:AI-2E family transporter [Thiohalobacter thiocyanaticus]RRQ21069.1 AI-2E family transporter [Thiohalobacter thiocyanaticus]
MTEPLEQAELQRNAPRKAAPAGEKTPPDGQHTDRLRRLYYVVVGLFVLALLGALHFGQPVLLPLATAFLLSFIFRPVTRRLHRWHIPYPLSALFMVTLVTAVLGFGAYSLAGPASEWIRDAPRALLQLQYKLADVRQSMEEVKEATAQVEGLGDVDKSKQTEVVAKDGGLQKLLLSNAREATVGVFTAVIMLFFILGWGDRLFRNIVASLTDFHAQRQAVEIGQEIEKSVSAYLVTITIINLLLGAVVAGVLYLMGMPNPALWGVAAGLLNFIPYLGPAVMAAILSLAAILSYPSLGEALMVPLAFLLITSIEGYLVTPLAVGRRLTLNPLVIFVSVVFWFWLWGIVGALLTVPILVCAKVALERISAAKPLAQILD